MTDKPSRPLLNALFAFCLILPLALLTSGCQDSGGQSNSAGTSTNQPGDDLSSQTETPGKKPPQTVNRPTLRWEAPATREDGSRLYSSDIKEYRVYYRLRYQEAFKAIALVASEGTAFALSQFKPGAYEFSVTVVDNDGRESQRSDRVSVDLI